MSEEEEEGEDTGDDDDAGGEACDVGNEMEESVVELVVHLESNRCLLDQNLIEEPCLNWTVLLVQPQDYSFPRHQV